MKELMKMEKNKKVKNKMKMNKIKIINLEIINKMHQKNQKLQLMLKLIQKQDNQYKQQQLE
jgi:type IV secretory pathway component VirB8